jgi:hypothetical protein
MELMDVDEGLVDVGHVEEWVQILHQNLLDIQAYEVQQVSLERTWEPDEHQQVHTETYRVESVPDVLYVPVQLLRVLFVV